MDYWGWGGQRVCLLPAQLLSAPHLLPTPMLRKRNIDGRPTYRPATRPSAFVNLITRVVRLENLVKQRIRMFGNKFLSCRFRNMASGSVMIRNRSSYSDLVKTSILRVNRIGRYIYKSVLNTEIQRHEN